MRNTRQTFGMAFARDDKSMQDGRWKYDSRKPKWTVDTKADPSHLGLPVISGGTNLALNLASTDYHEEILFEIEHKMPFPPAFLCFFYVIDTTSGFSSRIGQFQSQNTIMEFNAAQYQEGLFAQVDDTHFYIKHYTESFGFGAGTKNFGSADWQFRIRYELLNQEAFYFGDKGY